MAFYLVFAAALVLKLRAGIALIVSVFVMLVLVQICGALGRGGVVFYLG